MPLAVWPMRSRAVEPGRGRFNSDWGDEMHRWGLSAALVVLGVSAWGAEEAATFEGHELKVVSVARAKEFRDLKVKDTKKQDLAIVVVELRWTGEGRSVLIRDKDLSVRDSRGDNQECLLRFVQAASGADGALRAWRCPS